QTVRIERGEVRDLERTRRRAAGEALHAGGRHAEPEHGGVFQVANVEVLRGSIESHPEAEAAGRRDLLMAATVRLDAEDLAALAASEGEHVPTDARPAPPVGSQEVWAAGVTYRRSRDARVEEAIEATPYDRVYVAERPELFCKSAGSRVRGPDEPVAVRADSTWDVPEPELTLVLDARARIVGYTIGNDVSSRSIAGENTLYLPQAKTYDGSCAMR